MPHCIKTCIDNIYSNDVDPTAQSGVIKDKISHHNIVYFVKRLSDSTTSDQKSSQEKITIHYNYSNSNLDKLCAEIEDDMETLMYSCDTFEAFTNLFQQKIDNTCKLLTPRTTKRNTITNPWITQGLINSIEKKARLYFEWRDTCTTANPEGNSQKRLCYKEYKQYLKTAIKRAKAIYYANEFEKHSLNPKKTWSIINELRGKRKACTKDDFVIDGTRITCRRIIANKFNEYFTSLANNLNEQVLSSNTYNIITPMESFSHFMSNSVCSSIYLEDTNSEEVSKIIMELKNGKASDIPIVLVKKTATPYLQTPIKVI